MRRYSNGSSICSLLRWQNSNFSGTQHYNFSYDNNGNVINDGKRSFTYTADDKPLLVTQGAETTRFSYGPNRELINRIDARSSGTTTTLLIDNLYEQVQLASGVTEHKFVIGNAIVTRRTVGGPQVYYLHKDQQGSTTAITNHDGNAVQQLLYDPWGRQYQVSSAVLTYSSQATTYGYTGHDMVNDFEVIHMGGRSYNPVLDRFMQADPLIQQASNLQSFNRYAYVLNNPMSYTDPSGYFFKKIGKFLKDNWRAVVATVATIATYGVASGWAWGWGMTTTVVGQTSCYLTLSAGGAAFAGAVSGFVGGAIMSGSLRGAAKGALTGAITGGVAGHLSSSGASFKDATYRVAVSAAGGCAAGEVSGGNCNDGARKAAMAQAVMVSMEVYSGYKHSLKAAEGNPVVKFYGEGVRDANVSNVGESIEVGELSSSSDLAGKSLDKLNVEEAKKLIEEKVNGEYINQGKIWIKNGTVKFSIGTENAQWLQSVGRIPGMNSMAIFHDKWMANVVAKNSLFLAGTIFPSMYLNYTALGLGQYKYYLGNLKNE